MEAWSLQCPVKAFKKEHKWRDKVTKCSDNFFLSFYIFGSAVGTCACAGSAPLCVLNVRLMLDGEDPQPLLGVISYDRAIKTVENDEAPFVIVHVVKGVKGASLAHSRHGKSKTLFYTKLSKILNLLKSKREGSKTTMGKLPPWQKISPLLIL